MPRRYNQSSCTTKRYILWIEGFKEWFGNDYLIVGAFLQGELLGFIGYTKTPTALRAMHYGATSHAPDGLYSALMFEVIERGIQLEVLEINLGRTLLKLKAHMVQFLGIIISPFILGIQ